MVSNSNMKIGQKRKEKKRNTFRSTILHEALWHATAGRSAAQKLEGLMAADMAEIVLGQRVFFFCCLLA